METDYITLGVLKNTLSLTGTTYADEDLGFVITSASRVVDQLCSRRFYADDDALQVNYYTPERQYELDIDDLVTFTSLQIDSDGDGTFDQTWTLNTDFVLEPLNAQSGSGNPAEPASYPSISVHPRGSFVLPTGFPRTVKLTGKFGWPLVPDSIVTATMMLANLLLTVQRSAPLGIVAFDGGAIRLARGNPQVMMLVAPYEHHRRVAVA